MHKNISPQIVFHSPIHKWVLVSCCALPFIAFFYGASSGNISAELVFYFTSWSCSVAATLAAFGGYLAVENGKEKQQINEDEYQHWRARTLIPITLFGSAAIVLTLYYGSFLIVKKVNLTITAVPTPELMAQMKLVLFDKNIEHSKVKFNGKEQKITFYRDTYSTFNLSGFVKNKLTLPHLFLASDKSPIMLDHIAETAKFFVNIEGKRRCFEGKVITNITLPNFTKVTTQSDINFFTYNNHVVAEYTDTASINNNRNKAGFYCVLDRHKNHEYYKDFAHKTNHYLKYPLLSNAIKDVELQERLGFLSWKRLNELN
ncbi:hypothetical protein HR060_17230 [Catenovulum sp. SM1970]|uniref:hypothetical protein n=1 Tax=Marinifaba aquimaris TaxID=2741323 RepID=UPI001573D182|nr:hypothetical protein [Marinifaba aquimaris]NTS78589.1 hypothetical protein [Marinifaba aquimaris]